MARIGEKIGSTYVKAYQTFKKFYSSNDNMEKVKDAVTNNNIWLMLGDFNTEGWKVDDVITNRSNFCRTANGRNKCPLDNMVVKSGFQLTLHSVKIGEYNQNCGSDCHRPFLQDLTYEAPEDVGSKSEEESEDDRLAKKRKVVE